MLLQSYNSLYIFGCFYLLNIMVGRRMVTIYLSCQLQPRLMVHYFLLSGIAFHQCGFLALNAIVLYMRQGGYDWLGGLTPLVQSVLHKFPSRNANNEMLLILLLVLVPVLLMLLVIHQAYCWWDSKTTDLPFLRCHS